MSVPHVDPVLTGDPDLLLALKEDRLHDPHAVLGAHPARLGPTEGAVIRAQHPDAVACIALVNGDERPMTPLGDGYFAVFVPDRFRGGIVGAFLGAVIGALVSGALWQLAIGDGIGETDVLTALAALPGCLAGMAVMYAIGSRDEADPELEQA